MARMLLLLALASLAGCASTSSEYYSRDYYYDDGSYVAADDGYYYDDGYTDNRYYDGGSYYVGRSYGAGDYYYGDSGYTSEYLLWPAYYSLFYPLNRWYVDPYYYPGYYYGVTYFPRNYLSFSLTYGNSYRHGWGGYAGWYGGSYAYSPYRYSWADNYYDWYPWYGGGYRHSHNSRPRFGSARNEAERVLTRRNHDRAVHQSNSAAYGYRGNYLSPGVDTRGPRAASYPGRSNSSVSAAGTVTRAAAVGRSGSSAARNGTARDALTQRRGEPFNTQRSYQPANRQLDPANRDARLPTSQPARSSGTVTNTAQSSRDALLRQQNLRQQSRGRDVSVERDQTNSQGWEAYRRGSAKPATIRGSTPLPRTSRSSSSQRDYQISPDRGRSSGYPVREARSSSGSDSRSTVPRDAYRSAPIPSSSDNTRGRSSYDSGRSVEPSRSYRAPDRSYTPAPAQNYRPSQRAASPSVNSYTPSRSAPPRQNSAPSSSPPPQRASSSGSRKGESRSRGARYAKPSKDDD